MKSRMYTAEERAQAKLMSERTGDTKTAKSETPGTPTTVTSPADTEPQIDPNDHAEMKNYFEPTDATNTKAAIKLAMMKTIVESQLGVENEAAKARVLGITIDNVSKGGKSTINLRAIVNFREREQLLHLDGIVIDTAAKDIVSGTSDVALKFKSPTLDDDKKKPEVVTTKDLLVASMCLEVKGAACAHAYLILQFGRQDNLVDVAVFELDENMAIINSNIGVPPKSYEDAEKEVSGPLAPSAKPTATLETLKRDNATPPAEAVLRLGKPSVATKTDLFKLSAEKNAKTTFAPQKAPVVDLSAARPSVKAATPAVAPGAAAKPTASLTVKPAPAPIAAPVAKTVAPKVDLSNSKTVLAKPVTAPVIPAATAVSASAKVDPAPAAATTPAATAAPVAASEDIPTGTPFRGAKKTWNWIKSWF